MLLIIKLGLVKGYYRQQTLKGKLRSLEHKVQKKLQVVYRHTVNKGYRLATKRETKIYRRLLLEEEGGNATTTYTTSTDRTSGVNDAATRNGIERLRIVKNCQ